MIYRRHDVQIELLQLDMSHTRETFQTIQTVREVRCSHGWMHDLQTELLAQWGADEGEDSKEFVSIFLEKKKTQF